MTVLPDQVESIGPSRVGGLDLVIEAIYYCGKFDAQLAYASASYRDAFSFILWTREKNLVANVTLHLPDIGGVRLKNVDRVKIHLAGILLR